MKKFVPMIVMAVVVGGLGFYGGMSYQKSKVTANIFGGAQRGQFVQNGAQRRGGAGGGFVSGEVLSKNDTSITVKLPTGGSSIVFYSASTNIEKTASGSWSDIAVGKSVVIQGSQNGDGSYTAQSIQLSRQLPMRGQASPSPSK